MFIGKHKSRFFKEHPKGRILIKWYGWTANSFLICVIAAEVNSKHQKTQVIPKPCNYGSMKILVLFRVQTIEEHRNEPFLSTQ